MRGTSIFYPQNGFCSNARVFRFSMLIPVYEAPLLPFFYFPKSLHSQVGKKVFFSNFFSRISGMSFSPRLNFEKPFLRIKKIILPLFFLFKSTTFAAPVCQTVLTQDKSKSSFEQLGQWSFSPSKWQEWLGQPLHV